MPRLGDDSQWVPVAEGIYFTQAGNPQSVYFREWSTGRTREIFASKKHLAEGMSVSPDRRYVLYTESEDQNADIMLVRNFK